MRFNDIPEIDFVDKDLETIIAELFSLYSETYLATTGEEKTLEPADPEAIFIYAIATKIYQQQLLIDISAKNNLIKYATGNFLDNIGNRINETRASATKSKVTIKFILSAIQGTDITIPAGTRVTAPGTNIFFGVIDEETILAGNIDKDILCEALEAGTSTKGFTAGAISRLVDPITFMESVANTDTSQGGTDIQDDDDYAEDIRFAPNKFSVAGPETAYETFVKDFSTQIVDTVVTSPSAGAVDIVVLLEDGGIPSVQFLQDLFDSLDDKRPLTDFVTTTAPTVINYDITLTYYINQSDEANESIIQADVLSAIDDYKAWQKEKLARDVNPQELIKRVLIAGAKRLTVTSPTLATIASDEVAIENIVNITYGGLEND